MTKQAQALALLRQAHDALDGMSDSDQDWFEDEEEEAEAVPAQYAARKVMEAIQMLAELRSEPFAVKHYTGDERPTLKGNGFDGLELGTDREEAQAFVAWLNARLS